MTALIRSVYTKTVHLFLRRYFWTVAEMSAVTDAVLLVKHALYGCYCMQWILYNNLHSYNVMMNLLVD